MKKLKNLKLNDVSKMTEDEMKYVIGGYSNGSCDYGSSSSSCWGGCTITTGSTYFGQCRYKPMMGGCVCVQNGYI